MVYKERRRREAREKDGRCAPDLWTACYGHPLKKNFMLHSAHGFMTISTIIIYSRDITVDAFLILLSRLGGQERKMYLLSRRMKSNHLLSMLLCDI